MSLILELPPELESELAAQAARHRLPLPEYALRLLANGCNADSKPSGGTELLAYWQKAGLVGTRPDIADVATIYVGLGRADGVRAGDLVGAIANESNLSGREIGPIKISEKFSVVGVPTQAAQQVIAALSSTTIKGKRVKARPFVENPR